MLVTSQSPNDCSIVAIAQYTGKSYDEVKSGLPGYNPLWGTPLKDSMMYLLSNGFVSMPVPRRGRDKMNGIIAVFKGAKVGHMLAVIDGHVFDSIVQGMPIDTYCKNTGYHVRWYFKLKG